jgi:hypothetical protein
MIPDRAAERRNNGFPSLQRRGGRAINKMVPFRKGAAGVVAHKSRCGMRFETWCVSDHPVCAFTRWLRSILLMAHPPLLFKKGNPFSRCLTILRRSAACLVPLLIVAGAMAQGIGEPPDAPYAGISSQLIHARLYLPDAERGYYRATRFDWSGIVASLTFEGHTYFGRWFDVYDPKLHDSITGPVQEFVTGLGYDEAPAGGTFVKIGVGVLRKPANPPARGFFTYEIVDHGKWTVTVRTDAVDFLHEVSDPASGYGYRYKKTVSLTKNQPRMVLDQSLESTGRRVIETEMYDHNFFVIDNQPSGPDFEVTFPFEVTGSTTDLRGTAEVRSNRVVYLKELDAAQRIRTELKGFGSTPSDYDIRVTNRKTGAAVRVTSDRPLSNVVFWSARTVLSPEAYIRVRVEPGRTLTWKIFYDFYTVPPVGR